MKHKVYSGNPQVLESGFPPHLEAVFKSKDEADNYVSTWMNFYPKGNVLFWTETN